MKIKLNDRVRVGLHWLRPRAVGRVIEVDPERGENAFLVKFEVVKKDCGFDGGHLWLDEKSLEVDEH